MMNLCILVCTPVGGLGGSLLAGALHLETFSLGGFARSGSSIVAV